MTKTIKLLRALGTKAYKVPEGFVNKEGAVNTVAAEFADKVIGHRHAVEASPAKPAKN